MKVFCRFLILLSLAVLITLPPTLAGYQYMNLANNTELPAGASRNFEKAANLLFWKPDLYEKAGLAEQNNPQRAIHLFTIARQHNALTPKGQIGLGDAYQAIGDQDKALIEWEEMLVTNREVPAASQRLAHYYHTVQNYETEQNVLVQWLSVEPDNPNASESMGILLAVTADPGALPLLETAANASAQSAARLEQLITALKTSTLDRAYLLTLCGQALAQMSEWPLAEKSFLRATDANPQYAVAWAWLGLARQKNNAPEALPAMQNALKLDGKSASIRAMMGTYWQATGESQKASTEFKKSTELEPENPAWWLALGASDAQTNLPEALKSYIQAVNLEPQNASNWFALASFCVEHNAFIDEYGLLAALRAYALEPQNPLYMDMLGRAQMAAGQWQDAEVMYTRALKAVENGQTASIHYHLGLLYLQTSRDAQAKNELQLTVKLDPSGQYGAQAKKLLDRYYP